MKEDKELVRYIKSGSTEALEELIDRYYNDIFAFSYRTLGSYHDACDVTQEVFISMIKAIHSYREKNRFKSWIFTIAYNRCMNCISMRRDHQDINRIKDMSKKEDFVKRQVDREYVKEILDTLPVEQRQTLILKYYHDLTSREIGEITNTNISTVKSRLYQGIQKLRKLLEEGKDSEER